MKDMKDKKNKVAKKGAKKKTGMDKMSKAEHDMFKRAEKEGIITAKQHKSLPTPLLKAILKKKGFK
tara:strand:+ start:653 stop:850 length:198 start_codon:yes stop_codon:yes gene_type:complete